MMKERVSMAVYSKLGLPAPREVNARLYVNGEYAGLYTVIEPVDKNFLKRVFGEDDGYLYEYLSPTNYHFEYLGSDPALYSPRFFEPKTHEKDPDARPIEAMIRTMNSASDNDFPAAIAPYIDLPAFMKHLAVEDFLAETDGILSGMNNFYLYRFEKKTLSQFITKDKDLAFGGALVNADRPHTPLLANASKNVLVRRALSVPQARQAYIDTLSSLVQLAGKGGWLESEMTRIYDQIRDAAFADSNKQCYDGSSVHSCSNALFESEVAANLEFAGERGKYVATHTAELASDRFFAVNNYGGMLLTMANASPAPSVGYAVIDPDASSVPADGVAIFSYLTNGVVVTETSVPASAPVQRGLVYAENSGAVKTGIAIANAGEEAANVAFYYTDADGKSFGTGTIVIPARQQIARFVDQSPFNVTTIGRATLTFESSAPVYVTALRGLTNERDEFIVSTLPVVEFSSSVTDGSVIPHFADGGGWTTEILLLNASDEQMQGIVDFVDQATRTVTSTSSYSIRPRGYWRLRTSGEGGTIRSGAVRITSSGGATTPAALGILSFRKEGITVSEASVRATARAGASRMYVQFSDTIQTGIAIANPSNQSVAVNLEVTTLSGAPTSFRGIVTIPSNGQLAAFLNQIPGFEGLRPPFQGILRISTAAGSGVAVAGLRGRYNERGDFLIATMPPVDETATPPPALAFPHLVKGGGYSTQFIVYSGRTNAAPTGVIHVFDQSGNPIVP